MSRPRLPLLREWAGSPPRVWECPARGRQDVDKGAGAVPRVHLRAAWQPDPGSPQGDPPAPVPGPCWNQPAVLQASVFPCGSGRSGWRGGQGGLAWVLQSLSSARLAPAPRQDPLSEHGARVGGAGSQDQRGARGAHPEDVQQGGCRAPAGPAHPGPGCQPARPRGACGDPGAPCSCPMHPPSCPASRRSAPS